MVNISAFCPPGEEKVGTGCSPCDKGTFKDNDLGLFSTCIACSPDYTTANPSSTKETDCNISKYAF